jgi:hypothetical protein
MSNYWKLGCYFISARLLIASPIPLAEIIESYGLWPRQILFWSLWEYLDTEFVVKVPTRFYWYGYPSVHSVLMGGLKKIQPYVTADIIYSEFQNTLIFMKSILPCFWYALTSPHSMWFGSFCTCHITRPLEYSWFEDDII